MQISSQDKSIMTGCQALECCHLSKIEWMWLKRGKTINAKHIPPSCQNLPHSTSYFCSEYINHFIPSSLLLYCEE